LQRACFGEVKYGPHSLPRFFASWCIQQGFSPKRLQTPMGHSSITMTMDTYGHWLPTDEDDHAKFAADEMQIRGAGGGA
jgi:integrase